MCQQYKTEASMTKHNILFISLETITDTHSKIQTKINSSNAHIRFKISPCVLKK